MEENDRDADETPPREVDVFEAYDTRDMSPRDRRCGGAVSQDR